MKRSKMLEHMIEEIKDRRETLKLRPNTEPYFNKDLANNLLDMIEGFGMLPPDRALVHPELKYVDNSWEPEDDN